MKLILHFLYRLFGYKPKISKSLDNDDAYLSKVSFCLRNNKEIDIYCKLPDFHGDIKAIHNDSMVVAEFLHLINSGKLEKQLLSLIQEETEYNAEQKLFFENIVFYLTLLDTEKNKANKNSNNEPLIRPSRVFQK